MGTPGFGRVERIRRVLSVRLARNSASIGAMDADPQTSRAHCLAIVTHTIPGECSGQAVALERLASAAARGDRHPAIFFIDTLRDFRADGRARADAAGTTDIESVGTWWLAHKACRLRALHGPLFRLLVRQRAAAIAAIVNRRRPAAIIACTGGDLVDLPAAIEAGRRTATPVWLHYFDDYRMQTIAVSRRWSARVTAWLRDEVEPALLRAATGIIAPNETLADIVRARTDTPVVIVRNPVDTTLYPALRGREADAVTGATGLLRIIYTGTVYMAQVDAIRRCAEAVAVLADRGITAELHIHGPRPDSTTYTILAGQNIRWHDAVPPARAAALQAGADLLFLPLSFDTPYPELIRTSAPGKFGEYLAAATPMVIHAPAGSFPVDFARHHGCAAICTEPNAGALADTIAALAADPQRAGQIRTAARAAAADFAEDINLRRLLRCTLSAATHHDPARAAGAGSSSSAR